MSTASLEARQWRHARMAQALVPYKSRELSEAMVQVSGRRVHLGCEKNPQNCLARLVGQSSSHHDAPQAFRAAEYASARHGTPADAAFPLPHFVGNEAFLLWVRPSDPLVNADIAVDDASLASGRGRDLFSAYRTEVGLGGCSHRVDRQQ
jgi:hypothetical protein